MLSCFRDSFFEVHPMPSSNRPPAVLIMNKLGFQPDPWQVEVLEAGHARLLLNCCRQSGKSTVVAVLALVEAVFIPGTRVLILSRTLRQSTELFRMVKGFYARLNSPHQERLNASELLLKNGSRIVCLPCREDTIRGYSSISLIIIDEAARVPDDLYRAVCPMLAVSGGRLICLSTPYGKRGFYHDAWANGGNDWARIRVPADQVPRITADFLARERRTLGEQWYRQEYFCSFESPYGLVYPTLPQCVVAATQRTLLAAQQPIGRKVGGIDFGFRNPFAAVWGVLDKDDVLWLTGEHYQRQRPLSYHAGFLPKDVLWYCDPSGATERSELLHAGFKVRAGVNPLSPGIAAVTARIENGTLRILHGRCRNLLDEAELYRYSDDPHDRRAEIPLDDHNHALAALRYLIASHDAGRQIRHRAAPSPQPDAPHPKRPWLRYDNEALWTRFW
jgi:hypothetical protein